MDNKSGADAIRVGWVVVAAAAPHGAGRAGARGAEPPEVGRAVQFRNTLVVGGRAGPRFKVVQFRAVHRELVIVVSRLAYFVTRQKEYLSWQTVRTTLISAARTAVLTIRDLHLFDGILNAAVEQSKEGTVQVTVDCTILQIIHIRAVPLPVLHRCPSSTVKFRCRNHRTENSACPDEQR